MNDPSKWNVVVVDDEPDNVGVLELVLGFHDARVRVAESGHECLELLEQDIPTFMLVDIQMPAMSGYELLNKVRSNPEWRSIPIIAVTAHTMSGDAERILSAGFDGYIPKPINAMSLIDDLRRILTNEGES